MGWILAAGMLLGTALRAEPVCTYEVLLPLSDSEIPRRKLSSNRIEVAKEAFDSPAIRTRLAAVFGGSFVSEKMGAMDYERRARQFAEDDFDARVITHSNLDSQGRKTTWKLHLTTGEFVVVAPYGKISMYCRLPVTQRSIGGLRDTASVASALRDRVKSNRPGAKSYSRLTAGEDLGKMSFGSAELLFAHFDKHVADRKKGEPLTTTLERLAAKRGVEFPDFRDKLLTALRSFKNDPAALERRYRQIAVEYGEKASQMAHNIDARFLTITYLQANSQGIQTAVAMKYDPTTQDTLIVHRDSGFILSYYRPSLELSNQRLVNRHSLPPAGNQMEYFLSEGLHDEPIAQPSP